MDKFFKNTFIFYVFFQLLIFNSFGQNHEIGMTTKELNLNGEVRSIRESKFKAINKEGIITKGDLDSYGFIIQRIFNHNGNEIERLLFMNNGSLSQKFVSTYDSLGKLNNFKVYKPDGSLFFTNNFKYDDKGNLIEFISLNSEGLLAFRITSIYDGKNNKPVEKISYGSNGSVMFKDKNQYDKNGNLIEKSSYSMNGDLMFVSKFKYDAIGNEIERSTTNSEQLLVTKNTIRFDDARNPIESIEYNLDNGKNYVHTFIYEFDKNNNWIKKIEYEDKAPISITEREMEYY